MIYFSCKQDNGITAMIKYSMVVNYHMQLMQLKLIACAVLERLRDFVQGPVHTDGLLAYLRAEYLREANQSV